MQDEHLKDIHYQPNLTIFLPLSMSVFAFEGSPVLMRAPDRDMREKLTLWLFIDPKDDLLTIKDGPFRPEPTIRCWPYEAMDKYQIQVCMFEHLRFQISDSML